ncbi:hypothetical protein M885DRAFT_502750 [Pelagophyceae sp. CCMP2097]|nr:hypothetical protein M885DRAFT_502750 [Pelagophyceae sp. CCMP2097]
MQGPGTDDVAKAEAAKAASSDVERFLKAEFSEKALPALRSRLRALHSALADLAASREEAPDAPLPEPVARAESSTRDFIAGVKQKLRPPEFLTKLESLGGAKELSLRLEKMDLSYNDITDVGLQALIVSLATGAAPKLTKLVVEQTKVSDIGKRMVAGLQMMRKDIMTSL